MRKCVNYESPLKISIKLFKNDVFCIFESVLIVLKRESSKYNHFSELKIQQYFYKNEFSKTFISCAIAGIGRQI